MKEPSLKFDTGQLIANYHYIVNVRIFTINRTIKIISIQIMRLVRSLPFRNLIYLTNGYSITPPVSYTRITK